MVPKSRYCSQEELDNMLSDEKAAFLLFDGGSSSNIEETKEENKSAIFAQLNLFLLKEQMRQEKAPSEWSESGTFFADVTSFQHGTYDDTIYIATEDKYPFEWSESGSISDIDSFQTTDDIEPKKDKAHCEWSDVATNFLLDAAIKLNKAKFDPDDWKQIAHEVKTVSGEDISVKQCKVKLNNLSQKYGSECEDCALHNRPSEWQFFEKVESYVTMRKETTERCEWSKEETEALLKAHQRQLEERKSVGKSRLSHLAWEVIVNAVNASGNTGMLKTYDQCRHKLSTLQSKIKRKSS